MVKCWAKTQAVVALNSAEAELTGLCQAAGGGLGLQSLCNDLGFSVKLRLHTDSMAAIGICRRRGLGRVRHLAVADLWLQDRLRSGDFELCKVLGSNNVADLLTKYLDRATQDRHCASLGLDFEGGRAASAAHINVPMPPGMFAHNYDSETFQACHVLGGCPLGPPVALKESKQAGGGPSAQSPACPVPLPENLPLARGV